MDPRALTDLAEQAAREALRIIDEALDSTIVIADTKSSPTDLVTETDRIVEQRIIDVLHSANPKASFLAEESGHTSGSDALCWVIDPIDGTTNFYYGLPGFNVSIAAALEGEIVAGVVADPVRQEIFRATLGHGATCNGTSISCRNNPGLSRALIATGFSYDPERRQEQSEVITRIITSIRDIRRLGAAALDLCSVAIGRLDGYFESGLKPWDLAAGMLIAREAGAVVGGLDAPDPDGTLVIAAGPAMFDDLRDLLRSVREQGAPVADLSAQSGWKAGRLEAWEPTSSP